MPANLITFAHAAPPRYCTSVIFTRDINLE